MPEKPSSQESGPVKRLDVWAFTSRRAYREFERDGTLEKVQRDIENNVLEGSDWSEADRRYLSDIRQLQSDEAIEEKASYWYCSPFPATYRALKEGKILGREFRRGDDIVYVPAKNIDVEERLIIGTFSPTRETQLHEEHRAMKTRMER